MNLLITGAATPLGHALATGLRDIHQLRLTDNAPVDTDLEFVQCDLGHGAATDELVKGIDLVVHQAYQPRPGDGETTWLDLNSRCTYNLLLAASETGVERVLLLSTLDLFTPYDEDLTVGEHWQPRPSCEPTILGAHLAEFTTREFAHSHALKIVVVRLGHLVRAEEVEGQPYDPMWLDERDAVQAVAKIIEKGAEGRRGQYAVVHIQSDSARSRFSIGRAKSHLGFVSQYNFEANP